MVMETAVHSFQQQENICLSGAKKAAKSEFMFLTNLLRQQRDVYVVDREQ